MSDLFLLSATNFLTFVWLTSALAKTVQKPDPFTSYHHWILALLNARWFPLLEFGLGAILFLPAPLMVQACAAIALAIIVTVGQVLRSRHPELESEGFGSLTPSTERLYFVLDVAVLTAAAFVVFRALQTPMAVMSTNWWAFGITLAALIGAWQKLRYDLLSGKGYAEKRVDLEQVSELPPDIFLGADAQGRLMTGDLTTIGKPAVILAVSSHSADSRDAFAVLANHAKLVSKELTIVVIAQDGEFFRATRDAPMRQLIDQESHLSRFLGLRMRPYAFLVDEHLTLQAPPSRTSHTVQRLITLLINAIKNAPETYLTIQNIERENL